MPNKLKNQQNSKRIFLATPFENGLAKRGTRFIDIAEMLQDEGWEVNYLTTNYSHAYKYFFEENEILKEQQLRKYKLYFIPIIGYRKNISIKRILSNLKMSMDFYKKIKKLVKDGDYVLIPSRPVDFIYFISILKNSRRIKLILDIRDIWPDAFVKRNIIFDFYCNFFLKRSIFKYDLFFHISPSFTNWLKRYNENAKSIFVPPGFNPSRFQNELPNPKSNSDLNLVFIGALQFQLDILPVIKAIGNIEKYSLTIIGENGKGQRFAECHNYIIENNISNVWIKGVIEPDEVSKELEKFDIGIIPMISNSITNKFFDYLASYLPILVLGTNDSSEMVIQNEIGWNAKFDSEDILKVLNGISKEDINLKIQNIEKIKNDFNRDSLYKKILDNISKI